MFAPCILCEMVDDSLGEMLDSARGRRRIEQLPRFLALWSKDDPPPVLLKPPISPHEASSQPTRQTDSHREREKREERERKRDG